MKISELPLTTSVTGTEILPIVQSGTTKKVSIADALAGVSSGVGELNGLTGNLSLTSTDNSVTITPSGSTIDLSATGGGGVPTLQQVVDTGNTINLNNIFITEGYISILANGGYTCNLESYRYQITAPSGSQTTFTSALIQNVSPLSNDFRIYIDGDNPILTTYNNSSLGFYFNYNTSLFIFGDADNNDGVVLASASYLFGKSTSNIGVNLDFGNDIYIFGNYTNGYGVKIDLSGNNFYFGNTGTKEGIWVDYTNKVYALGDTDGAAGASVIAINDNLQLALMNAGNLIIAICNATDRTFLAGDLNGNANSTTFGLDDNAETLLASSNLLVGTSGSSSGQHLKINVGGTDYVIELKNP